jgi:hypothetical protein
MISFYGTMRGIQTIAAIYVMHTVASRLMSPDGPFDSGCVRSGLCIFRLESAHVGITR